MYMNYDLSTVIIKRFNIFLYKSF